MFGAFLQRAPVAALFLFCGLQCVLWTLAPYYTHDAPPLDVVESTMWGREWVLATYKHPALPSWFLEGLRLLTGATGWPAYVASQFCVVLTFAFVYRLGRDLFETDENAAQKALAGVLLLAGVYYFSWPTPEFNHNIAQMPLFAAVTLLTWRATTRDDLMSWVLLGLSVGLCAHVKYSAALIGVFSALWILFDGRPFARLTTRGPWIALATALIVAAPQLRWFALNGDLPLHYAAGRTIRADVKMPFLLVGAILAAHAVAFLMALGSGLFGRRALAGIAMLDARARRFLLVFAIAPAATIYIFMVVARVSGHDMWFSPMANLSGLLMIALTAGRWSAERLSRLAAIALAVLVAVPAVYVFAVDYAPNVRGKLLRTAWPQKAIATRLREAWAEKTGAPLRIVAGDEWVAGLVGLDGPSHPSILTNGNLRLSPWITPERLTREGALVAWQEGAVAPSLIHLAGDLPQKSEIFDVPGLPTLKPVRIVYAILPPGAFKPDAAALKP